MTEWLLWFELRFKIETKYVLVNSGVLNKYKSFMKMFIFSKKNDFGLANAIGVILSRKRLFSLELIN